MKIIQALVLAAFLAAPGSLTVQATERCPYLDYQNIPQDLIVELCREWSRSRPGTGTSSGDGNTWYGQPRECATGYACQGVDV